MATQSGRKVPSLEETLYARPARFEFFQAVRLIAGMRRQSAGVAADDPDDDAVRFRSEMALRFPTSDVTMLVPAGDEESAPVMTVAFLGMATHGSFGSLPLCYLEEVLEQEREKNYAVRDFFDLFNHRFVSLFYRAWEKHSLPVQFEGGASRFFERALFGVIGIETAGLSGRLAVDDRALLSRAGLLASAPISASALECLVADYFEVPVEVHQFLPAWYDIDPEEQNRLGRSSSRLEDDLYLGSRVRLAQFKFAVRLGPLSWDQYRDFFPTTSGFRELVDLVSLAVTPELDFEARLVLKGEEVPAVRLERTPSHSCRLGWSTWLNTEELRRDPDDAVLTPQAARAPVHRRVHPDRSLDSMEVRM